MTTIPPVPTTEQRRVTSPRSTARPVTALAKFVAVVESLGEQRRVSDIARATGLAVSTAHRILGELAELGWVHQAGDREYLPGPRLLAMAGSIGAGGDQATLALPALQALCDRTGNTVHFGVRQGDEAVYVQKIDGRRAYMMRSRIGNALPLHSTAIGKALLSALPETEVRGITRRTGLPPRTPATIVDEDELLEHLAAARRRGWAVDNGENELHTRCIGAVVWDVSGPIGGVSLSALEFDMTAADIRRLAPMVIETATAVSHALGGSPRKQLRASEPLADG